MLIEYFLLAYGLTIPSLWMSPGFHQNLLKELGPALPNTGIQDHSISTLPNTVLQGSPTLQDLMPDDLRGRWYNNRNKVHDKCDALKASWNHPPTPGLWKNCLPWNLSLLSKRLYHSLLPPKLCLISHASNKVRFSLLVLKGNKDNANPHSLKSLHNIKPSLKDNSRYW